MKKVVSVLKDGAVGLAMGTAIIVPGISAGTIALVFGAFKKIVGAVSGLFKKFWRSLLILLPFVIGAILAVAGLYIPFQYAFKYCMFAIVCLFAGFILGSVPGVTDKVKGERPTAANIVLLVVGFLVAGGIGALSFVTGDKLSNVFANPEWYLYLIVLAVGIVGAAGLIVPGLSGSLILLVAGFYKPIFDLPHKIVHGISVGHSIGLLATFAVGVVIGFVLWSKLMNYLLDKHAKSTYYTIIGFVCGSLVAIFVNYNMFTYIGEVVFRGWILDWILGPILFIVGLAISYLMVVYVRKHPQEEKPQEEAKENA
ncbi:MAG: DUF368 domain-containing protein [Bacilli bacterium]|nr:DUF368 domain-containing protein [Bacilli bacterium]